MAKSTTTTVKQRYINVKRRQHFTGVSLKKKHFPGVLLRLLESSKFLDQVSNWQIPAVVKDLVKKTEETSMENLAYVPSAAHRRLTSTKGNTNQ